jgi:uncharacterized peroxidase-related enzyme
MARLKVVDPKAAEGKVKELFEGPLKGMHRNIFKGLANSPAALQAYLAMGGALKGGMLSDAEREVIALAVGEQNGCDYCVAAHTMLGKFAGLTEAQTLEARRGAMQDRKLDALAKFVRMLNEKRGNVGESDVAALRAAGYGDGHIAEAIANHALNIFTNYFNHANETEVDFPAPPALR